MNAAPYVDGWTDALARIAPDLVGELSREIEGSLCAGDASDPELMSVMRIVAGMPELASDRGFECLFSGRKQEDVVLWYALDAFRLSGLPKSETLAKLERTARDPRTRLRFLTPEQQDAQIAAGNGKQWTPEPISIVQLEALVRAQGKGVPSSPAP